MNWFLTKILSWVLLAIGVKGTLAQDLAKIGLKGFYEAKAAVEKAKAEGLTDEQALDVAEQVLLSPYHPDRKRTLDEVVY